MYNLPVYWSDISTHSLTRRLTTNKSVCGNIIYNFNSQPHKEADIFETLVININCHFNSQPHKEADEEYLSNRGKLKYFNSQPHKEADLDKVYDKGEKRISTHSLTRRLTKEQM